ncbi:hypothetical protein EW093_14940 [Thiospirochaeta perfilievii]|uniref:Uncharacterized protein n=1 Tax=Thiospirochaeta perfilievii TaxID=252967 RepID=A0A5C1QCY9_9SPIO|nr:hypothetical protein [Thiospirochaeta perfilievii]QEN05935.1 hypothetical protein EW093_14940 [Thiospirochaeta perfilievii]
MSKASLELSNKIYSLDSELSNLFNQIEILNKKNSLLRTQVDINDIASTELGFYIDENQKSLELSQNVLKRVRDIVTTTRDITQELNTLLLNSELDTQRDLELLMSQINSDYSKINSLRDESELLLSNNENNLRKLKQILNSTTIDSDNKSKQTKEIVKNMEDNYNRAEDIVGDSFILKNSIESNYQTISKLNSVSGDKFNNLTELYNNISDPISWIEIYKNKSFVLYNNGKKLTE